MATTAILSVWRYPNYVAFQAGWVPHHITSWIQRVGVAWLAWELSRSNAWVGAVAAADLAPMIVLSPIAGAVADRLRAPLQLLFVSKALLLVQAIALAWLAIAGELTIELLFILSLVTGIINPFTSAARQIIVAGSVPRASFATAIALDSALFQASRFVGPALAALMIRWWNVESTLVAHVFGSLVILVSLFFLAIPPPDHRGRRKRGLLIDIAEGLGYARQHGAIWPLFLLLAAASILLRPIQELLPGFASKVFQSGPDGLAWLASAMGLGAMVSATAIAVRGRLQGLTNWALGGGLILIVATLGLVATQQLWIGIVFAAVSAFGLNTMSTSIQTITQSVVSDHMRGRVMSLYTVIFRGFPAIGALVLGAISDAIGLPISFALTAAVTLIVWSLITLRHRAMAAAIQLPRQVDRTRR